MSRLIETMRIWEGRLQNAGYHLERIERSSLALFGQTPAWNPRNLLANMAAGDGIHKCRLVYDDNEVRFTIDPYTIRPVNSLKIVVDNDIVYDHKLEDRTAIGQLLTRREDCNDILIIKDGMVTDVSYANIVFKKGNEWYTPSTYLLNGTMRRYLIDSKKIKEVDIGVNDIRTYSHFKLINAMLAFDASESEVLNIR